MDCPVKKTCIIFQNIYEIFQDNAKLQAQAATLRKENEVLKMQIAQDEKSLPHHVPGNNWEENDNNKIKIRR